MQEIKLLISGHEIRLPENFSMSYERESPALEIGSVITGGVAFNIRFPYGDNRITMNHAERIDLVDRIITYPAEVYVDGERRFSGIFQLQRADTDAAINGFYSGSLVDNALQLDLAKPLSDLLAKEVNLGSTPASVIAAAKAQNHAAMSTNGSTGAVMKFVPHHNPDFYGDTNPDWDAESRWYDPTREYIPTNTVLWQPSGDLRRPKMYTAKVVCAAGESPATEPTQWEYRALGICNHWDSDAGAFLLNKLTFLAQRPVVNSTNLVPWIQLHDIIRNMAAAIGYTVSGSYMRDAVEQRALVYSNFAQDRRIMYRVIAEIETQSTTALDTFDKVEFVAKDPTAENDPAGIWDDADHAFVTSDEGFISVRISGTCDVGAGATGAVRLYFQIEDGILTAESPGVLTTDGFDSWTAAAFSDGPLPFEVEFIHYSALTGADFNIQLWHYWTDGGEGHFGTISDVQVEMKHITREGLSDPLGLVSYTNHAPALSGAETLSALAEWKCLHITFDPLSREMVLDYRNDSFQEAPKNETLDSARDASLRAEILSKRRYAMSYGNSPSPAAGAIRDYELLDPVAAVADLPAPPLFTPASGKFGKAALVLNENAYYVTDKNFDGSRTEWRFFGHHFPALQIETSGDLVDISPAAGPIGMGRFWDAEGLEVYNPVAEGEGRSASIPINGERPPLIIAYWIGSDNSINASGYPTATTSGRNGTGVAVLNSDMGMQRIFDGYWKRTLQMLVLEERYTALFKLTPTQRQIVDFRRLMLIGHVPVLPIRTREQIGASELMEIESRKVKQVMVSIIGADSEAIPVDPIDINDYYVPYGLNGTIATVENDTYTILISAPYNAILQAVGGALDDGTCTIKVRVNGVAITPASAITTTYSEVEHPEETLILLGDTVELEITAATAAEVLNFVVKLLLIP